jgi:hypothetical protein
MNSSCNSVTTPTLQYKVPTLLWQSFESTLLANSRSFIRECAKRLDVPEKELLKSVMPTSDMIKICMIDTSTIDLQCQAYKHDKYLIVRCRKPVTCGSQFCQMHQTTRLVVIPSVDPPVKKIRRLEDSPDRPPLWVDEKNNVINHNAVTVGKWIPSISRLVLYNIIE